MILVSSSGVGPAAYAQRYGLGPELDADGTSGRLRTGESQLRCGVFWLLVTVCSMMELNNLKEQVGEATGIYAQCTSTCTTSA